MLKASKDFIRLGASYLSRDKPALLTFLFHSIYKDEQELEHHHIDPQQHITVEHFRRFVEYYLECGYTFVSPDDVIAGLDSKGRYVMATFDDGYFNNSYVVPVLQQYKVPAVFYIATDFIQQNKCYWWDVVYRELYKQGLTKKAISPIMRKYKGKKQHVIEKMIVEEFGKGALNPLSDIDRPFTPEELQQFSAEDYVTIGNHTTQHGILTNYSYDEIYEQMQSCQQYLTELLGAEPNSIAYPNGNYNQDVINAADALGVKLGITTEKKKNYLPLSADKNQLLALSRFTLWGTKSIERQCAIFRSDVTKQRFKG